MTLLSCALLVGFLHRTPQALYGDPACQLKAMQQFLAHESSSFNRMTIPDPNDVTRDTTEWFSWWPPGAQLVIYPLASRGISLGTAMRVVTVGFIILGSVGWVFWFNLFNLPKWVQVGWAFSLPWMHYASKNAFYFSAEVIAFASVPWILWSSDALAKAARRLQRDSAVLIAAAFVLGLGFGSCYVLRYAIVFASLAAILYLWFELRAPSFIAVAIGCVIPVAAMNAINYIASHDVNPVVLTAGLHLKWLSAPWITALSALALADGYSLLSYIFLHPVHGLLQQEWPICLIGLPGGILLFVLLYRRRGERGPTRLAILNFATAVVMFLTVWNFSLVGDYDARYLAVYSMGVLPVALEEGFVLWRLKRGALWKTGLALAGLCYVLVPLLYGFISVAVKVWRTPSDYAFGPSHVYNELLADNDLAGVRKELLSDFHPATDIWYLPDFITALDIPGRAIICNADWGYLSGLKRYLYLGSAPRRIRLLLPPRLEFNGRGPIVRRSFPQVAIWTRRKIQGCNYDLWEGTLNPHDR